MKLFLSSPLLWAYEPAEVLEIAANLGYEGVELWAYHLHEKGVRGAEVGELAQQAAELELGLTVHTLSWDLNFCSPLDPIREASLDLLRESIDLAAALGAGLAVMHPGRRTVPGAAFDDYWPLLTQGLCDLAQYASERRVRLAVEHMEPLANEFMVGPEDAQRLFAEVDHPNLTLAFDLAHVPWGVDPVSYYQQMPPVGHLHLSDASPDRRHLALGEGAHDLVPFLSHLAGHYEGAVVVEGIEHQRTKALAARNKQAWDRLAGMIS